MLICSICETVLDHYPHGDEEYGCVQEVEVGDSVVFPHNFLTIDEHLTQLDDWGIGAQHYNLSAIH